MPFLAIFGGLFSFLGEGVKAIFGFKQEQAEAVKAAIGVLSDNMASNAQREQAIAMIISSENSSGYFLSAIWRPLTMMIFLIMLISFWFGYVPPNLIGPMPPMIQEIFNLIQIGLCGYIPARTVEKVFSNLNLTRVLQTFIEKKLL